MFVPFALLLLCISVWLLKSYFAKNRFDGPNIIHHVVNILLKPMSIATQEAYMKYKDKKAFKVWEGFMPLIFICDPKLIQEITVRDYDKFTNRRFVANGECFNTGLISAQDAQWKKARSAVSNAFTSAKLRQMTPTINQCIERLLDVVGRKDGQVVDFRQLFQSFTLDVSFGCIYGTKVDDIYNPRHPLRVRAEESSLDPNLRVICGLMFPEFFNKIGATCFAPSVVRFWESLYRNLMKQKKKTCFAERADWMHHFTKALEENSEKTLTETEIIGNAITLTQAAYVSGGGALMFCSYFLAKHPEVQEKVFEELKTVDDINHDTIGQLKYLKCCIFETLRLYPPMERMERQSKTNYQLGDTGFTIPKGHLIVIPIYAIQRDPFYFDKVEDFIPERFEEKELGLNDGFLPFGNGPRFCVAQRFAMDIVTICLARLIKRYKLKMAADTDIKLKVLTMFMTPKEMKLVVEKRSN